MFAYWQLQPPVGSLVPNDLAERCPLFCSDLYFDLGLINPAQRWAYEAYATVKTQPVVRQLALVNFGRGDLPDARRCCALLRRTIFGAASAQRFECMARGPQGDSIAARDPRLAALRAAMPDSDFVVHGIGDGPDLDLITLVGQKKNNKMAFEYLIAYFLLTCQVEPLADNIKSLETLNYPTLPRHYEEALVFLTMALKKPVDLGRYHLSSETIDRFNDFMRIVLDHNGDSRDADKELKTKYGATYWYFLYNARPAKS
jgi:hypothetical protein